MSAPHSELHALLDALVAPADRWLFVRRVLGPDAPLPRTLPDGPGWVRVLADAPVKQVLSGLRHAAPHALAQVDALAVALLPLADRLRRVVPVVPSHLCLVGRTDLAESLLAQMIRAPGQRLQLVGPSGSGRSLVAAQVALLAVEALPVVSFLDGRTPAGITGGMLALAAELGIPGGSRGQVLGQLSEWLASQSDWMVVVDDAPEELPPILRGKPGRVFTVGAVAAPSAECTVALPKLSTEDRAEVVRRWSRGRLPVSGSTTGVELGALVVMAAAAGRGLPASTPADAEAGMSAEARQLSSLLGAFAAAPVPRRLLSWPDGHAVPDAVPPSLHGLLRSARTAREAAHELVRLGRAHWVGDALVRGRVEDPFVSLPIRAAAALLVLHALHDSDGLPHGWEPHVVELTDEPRVPAHLRRALATRAGRLTLCAGDPDTAVDWFQRGLAALDTPDPAETAALLNDLGVAWRRAGKLREAAAVLRDALVEDEAIRPPQPVQRASTLTNLAHVLRDQGAFEDAHAHYAKARDLRLGSLGADHIDTAAVVIQLGVTARALGRDADAGEAWREAERALRRQRPLPRKLLADVWMHQAQMCHAHGQLAEGASFAEHAHRQRVLLYNDIDHPEVRAVRELLRELDRQQVPGGSSEA